MFLGKRRHVGDWAIAAASAGPISQPRKWQPAGVAAARGGVDGGEIDVLDDDVEPGGVGGVEMGLDVFEMFEFFADGVGVVLVHWGALV